MTRYYIEYKDGKDWYCNHLDTPTPSTLSAAADLMEYVMAEYGPDTECRVTVSSDVDGKTYRVLNFIDQRKMEAEADARIDAAHDRMETHGWDQV